jgi:hypothetical protein
VIDLDHYARHLPPPMQCMGKDCPCDYRSLCSKHQRCMAGHVRFAPKVMSPTDALDLLFRENAIPMSDRNGRLYDMIKHALGVPPVSTTSSEIVNGDTK